MKHFTVAAALCDRGRTLPSALVTSRSCILDENWLPHLPPSTASSSLAWMGLWVSPSMLGSMLAWSYSGLLHVVTALWPRVCDGRLISSKDCLQQHLLPLAPSLLSHRSSTVTSGGQGKASNTNHCSSSESWNSLLKHKLVNISRKLI